MFVLALIMAALFGGSSKGPRLDVADIDQPPSPTRAPKGFRCPENQASPADYHPYPRTIGMHTLCVYPRGEYYSDGDFATPKQAWWCVVLGALGEPISPVFGPNSSPARAAAFGHEWRANT